MTAHRKLTLAAVVGVLSLLLVAVTAEPAAAHGAPTSPVSRTAACGLEGGETVESPACQAALAEGGLPALEDWDNVRLPNVEGRDRELIPDGRLCSAGLDGLQGLDLPRDDWPVTALATGSEFTFTYRATIPHSGTFRLYVTRDGYDPSQPLTWDDLEEQPFATATDPPLQDGSYQFEGTLPANKSGRHVIYTIWRNTDTPDTYYSCSDVEFGTDAGTDADAAGGAEAETATAQPSTTDASASEALPLASDGSNVVPLAAGTAAVLAVLVVTLMLRRRRS